MTGLDGGDRGGSGGGSGIAGGVLCCEVGVGGEVMMVLELMLVWLRVGHVVMAVVWGRSDGVEDGGSGGGGGGGVGDDGGSRGGDGWGVSGSGSSVWGMSWWGQITVTGRQQENSNNSS